MRLLDMSPQVSSGSVAADVALSAMLAASLLAGSVVAGLGVVLPNTAPLLGQNLAHTSVESSRDLGNLGRAGIGIVTELC
jgi:hypothetical protein